MLSELILIHRATPCAASSLGGDEEWVEWKTCLRQIFLTHRPRGALSLAEHSFPTQPGDQIFRATEAYRFLLEILCGLHSRVLGENEIVSQFKKRFLEEALPASHADSFRKLAQALLADMKIVRRSHPLNAGSHSYGSYCRKESESDSAVSLLGTGELAFAVLPWLAGKETIRVYHRSESGRDSLQRKLCDKPTRDAAEKRTLTKSVTYFPLSSEGPELRGTLVIAAPLSAREIEAMIVRSKSRPSRLIDLRGESAQDPILPISSENGGDIPILDLQDFFRDAEASNRSASVAREAAMVRVAELADARLDAESMMIRTQGWEDLCG